MVHTNIQWIALHSPLLWWLTIYIPLMEGTEVDSGTTLVSCTAALACAVDETADGRMGRRLVDWMWTTELDSSRATLGCMADVLTGIAGVNVEDGLGCMVAVEVTLMVDRICSLGTSIGRTIFKFRLQRSASLQQAYPSVCALNEPWQIKSILWCTDSIRQFHVV